MRGPWDVVDDARGQVLVPIDQPMGELVRSEEDRRDREADAQEPERLVRGILAERLGIDADRLDGWAGSDGSSHGVPPPSLYDGCVAVRRVTRALAWGKRREGSL